MKCGISVGSDDCILCGNHIESLDHCFFTCSKVEVLWRKLWSWWDIRCPRVTSLEQFKSGLQIHSPRSFPTKIYEVVYMVNLWAIWQWRNRILHADVSSLDKHRGEDIFPDLQRISIQWLGVRHNKINMDVHVWIRSPINVALDPG